MIVKNSVMTLRQNVRRMLNTLSSLDNDQHTWLEESKKKLRKLDQKLGALALAPEPILQPRVEMEFYTIIESHPKLRQASQVVFKEELVEICMDGLRYYADLVKARPLTDRELEQLVNVEKEHEKASVEFDQLRSKFLETDGAENGT